MDSPEVQETPTESPEEGADKQQTRDDSPKSARKKDALSMFLIGLVVLLGAMYLIDSSQERTLLSQSQAAKAVDTKSSLGVRCKVEATGLAGRTMLVACQGMNARAVAMKWSSSKMRVPGAFDDVAFRDQGGTLVCAGEPTGWPKACQSHPALSKEALRKARRRRTKREE